MESEKYVIPFCILAENRKEPFGSDLESAAVFAISELEREKGGGYIKKQPEEKTMFITKIGYPLWIIPWSEYVLVFDGLSKAKSNVSYVMMPEVKPLIEESKRSQKTRETYSSFLGDHTADFQDMSATKALSVDGLMANPEFLKAFDSSRRLASSSEDAYGNVALLSPFIDESAISNEITEIESLCLHLQNDLEDLNRCMRFLNKTTRHYSIELQEMMKAAKESFNLKIEAEKERVAPEIEELNDEYNVRITGLTKHYESQRIPIRREIVRLEKDIEYTRGRFERYKLEARRQAENDKPAVEKKWKEKASEEKKRQEQLEDQLKQAREGLKSLEERRSLETIKLKDELEARVKDATKTVAELESSRDARLFSLKHEKEQMENETTQITSQIGKGVKLLEADLAQFPKLGVHRELGYNENALFYIPFYLICYKAEQTKRYFVLPPSVAAAIGFSTKLKGVLRRARIKKLLRPRFEAFSQLADAIQALISQNPAFESEVKELGAKLNLLNSGSASAEIKKGLGYLKKEGWFSEKEYEAINQKVP